MALWTVLGRLDIVAVADGKLVPASYLKIVQPAEQGIVKEELLELRAPQAGVVKDLATHTEGTVAAPGTILLTLVPEGDKLVAGVWVSNDDVGFVRPGQPAKLKLAPFHEASRER